MGILATFVAGDTKPVALLISGNAYGRLVGVPHITAGQLVAPNGAHIDGPGALMNALDIPGLLLKEPLVEGDRSGVASTADAGRIDAMRSIDEVSDLVGQNTVATCRSLADCWDKVAKTPFFSAAQIAQAKACCLLGLLAFPASAREVRNVRPDADPNRTAPIVTDATRASYDAIVNRFKLIRNAYYARQYAAAAQAARDAASDVVFWDTVYAVVQTVAEAPANVVGAVGDATLSFAGGFLARTWYLWVIAGGLAFVWFNKGLLAAAANRKALAVLKVPHADPE